MATFSTTRLTMQLLGQVEPRPMLVVPADLGPVSRPTPPSLAFPTGNRLQMLTPESRRQLNGQSLEEERRPHCGNCAQEQCCQAWPQADVTLRGHRARSQQAEGLGAQTVGFVLETESLV